MMRTDRPEALAQRRNSAPLAAAETDARGAGSAACPDDCHYCSGPETD